MYGRPWRDPLVAAAESGDDGGGAEKRRRIHENARRDGAWCGDSLNVGPRKSRRRAGYGVSDGAMTKPYRAQRNGERSYFGGDHPTASQMAAF
jgi:hypothetical protein